MSLDLSNSVAKRAGAAINTAQIKLKRSGDSIGTGNKSPITNITSYILGSGLKTEVAVIQSVLKGIGYGGNLLNVAMSGLDSIEDALLEQLQIAVEADTPSAQQLEKLQDTFDRLTAAVTRIAANVEFDGRALLTGELGGNSTVRNAFDTTATTVGVLLNGATLAAGAGQASSEVTANGVNAGDTVTIDGVVFTFVNGAALNDTQVSLGADDPETARNLAAAIARSSNEGLVKYEVSVNAAVVSITRIGQSDGDVPVQSSDAGRLAVAPVAPGAPTGIAVSGVTNDDFIGTVAPAFTVIAVETGNGIADNNDLIAQYGLTGLVAASGNVGDQIAIFSATIGEHNYIGGLNRVNGGDLNNAQMIMRSDTGGGMFTLTFDAAYDQDIGTALNAANVSTALNAVFAGSSFLQREHLEIDNSEGNIIVGSNIVGSTTGLVASLTTNNFTDLQFEDFTITDNGGNQHTFEAKIGGVTYTSAALNDASLVKGFKIDMDGGDGKTFSLNIGDVGLNLSNATNTTAVQKAFQNALGIGGGINLRVGSSETDTVDIQVDNVTAKSLYLDSNGVYQANIDITTAEGRAVANEVLRNALSSISSAVASVGSQISNLELAAAAADNARLVQQEASDSYLSTNYEEEVGNYTEYLNRIQAAIATIIKSAAIAQAVLNLINNG